METRTVRGARKDHLFLIVVEDLLGHAAQGRKGMQVAAYEGGKVGGGGHLGIERPGEAQDEDEEVERSGPAGTWVPK